MEIDFKEGGAFFVEPLKNVEHIPINASLLYASGIEVMQGNTKSVVKEQAFCSL